MIPWRSGHPVMVSPGGLFERSRVSRGRTRFRARTTATRRAPLRPPCTGTPPFNTSPAAPGMPTTNVAAHSAGDLPTYPGTELSGDAVRGHDDAEPAWPPLRPATVHRPVIRRLAPAYANNPNTAQKRLSQRHRRERTYQYQPPQNQTPAAADIIHRLPTTGPASERHVHAVRQCRGGRSMAVRGSLWRIAQFAQPPLSATIVDGRIWNGDLLAVHLRHCPQTASRVQYKSRRNSFAGDMREPAGSPSAARLPHPVLTVAMLLAICCAWGCAAIKATRQPTKKNLSVLTPGTPPPRASSPTPGGRCIAKCAIEHPLDLFVFKQGSPKANKATRAFVHGAEPTSPPAACGRWLAFRPRRSPTALS